MATESVEAQALKAEPIQVLETGQLGGRERAAFFELNLEGEAAGTVFDLVDLAPNAVIKRIELHQTASSTTVFNIGDTNDNDGIIDGQAVNQNLTLSMTNQNGGSNGMGPADFKKQLWEVLGYATRKDADGNIRVQARNPSSAVSSAKLFGHITYVVD